MYRRKRPLILFALILAVIASLAAVQAGAVLTCGFLAKWGTHGSANGQFDRPGGIATDAAGNVYVSDTLNNRVQIFKADGLPLATLGSAGTAPGQFASPLGIAVSSTGEISVVDSGNGRIQVFSPAGGLLRTWGGSGSADGLLSAPYDICVDADGNSYVSDCGNNRVEKFSATGAFIAKWGPNTLLSPKGIELTTDGALCVIDSGNDRIVKYGRDGTFIGYFGSRGSGIDQFKAPGGLCIDATGNIFVADTGNYRIQKYNADADFISRWGFPGSADGCFGSGMALACDATGNIYVADTGNDRVQKFQPVNGDPYDPGLPRTVTVAINRPATLKATDGLCNTILPARVATCSYTVTVDPRYFPAMANANALRTLGRVYDFGFRRLNGSRYSTLNRDVTISFGYATAELGGLKENRLWAFWRSEMASRDGSKSTGSIWRPAPRVRRYPGSNRLTTRVRHFSQYAIMADLKAPVMTWTMPMDWSTSCYFTPRVSDGYGSGIKCVRFYVDSMNGNPILRATDRTYPYSYKFDIIALRLAKGSHTIKILAEDNVGNQSYIIEGLILR